MKLNQKQVDALKRAIDARQEELVAEVRADVSRSRDEAAGRQAGEVSDSKDQASAEQAVRLNVAELLLDLDQLSQVQAARTRLESGTFGVCTDCGGDIPYERLRAQLAALRCVDCQRLNEEAKAQMPGVGR
jgi:DnaK suppressor protein